MYFQQIYEIKLWGGFAKYSLESFIFLHKIYFKT